MLLIQQGKTKQVFAEKPYAYCTGIHTKYWYLSNEGANTIAIGQTLQFWLQVEIIKYF